MQWIIREISHGNLTELRASKFNVNVGRFFSNEGDVAKVGKEIVNIFNRDVPHYLEAKHRWFVLFLRFQALYCVLTSIFDVLFLDKAKYSVVDHLLELILLVDHWFWLDWHLRYWVREVLRLVCFGSWKWCKRWRIMLLKVWSVERLRECFIFLHVIFVHLLLHSEICAFRSLVAQIYFFKGWEVDVHFPDSSHQLGPIHLFSGLK